MSEVFALIATWLAFGLLSLVVARRSQIDAYCNAHPRIAGVMRLLRALGIDPFMLAQSASLIVKGRLPIKLQAEKIVAEQTAPPVAPEVLAEVKKQSEPTPPKDPPFFPPAATLLFACIALSQGACSGAQKPVAAECGPDELAKIEAAYIAEAVQACGDATYDDCEELPAIREKYKAIREEWKRCGQ